MFADLDYSHQEVCDDVKNWGVWIANELNLKGWRLDAVQHFSERFTNEWVDYVNEKCGDKFYVGEFWNGEAQPLCDWLEMMHKKFSLFDAPLLNNFSNISKQEAADLRKVFDKTLVQAMPVNAVVRTPPLLTSFNVHYTDITARPASRTTTLRKDRRWKPLSKDG